jgi:hypothetical protein
MVEGLNGTVLTVRCANCNKEVRRDMVDVVSNFLPEFNQYENVVVECTCGSLTVVNVNIPENDTDEPFETGELPLEEEIARHYVRSLQREIRADFVEKRKAYRGPDKEA